MKSILLFIVFFLVSTESFSQSEDSIQVWKYKIRDTERVKERDTLIKILSLRIEKILSDSNACLTVFENLNKKEKCKANLRDLCLLLRDRAWQYNGNDKTEAAIYDVSKAIGYFYFSNGQYIYGNEIKKTTTISNLNKGFRESFLLSMYAERANLYWQVKNYDLAIKDYETIVNFNKEYNRITEASHLENLASLYFIVGNYDSSLYLLNQFDHSNNKHVYWIEEIAIYISQRKFIKIDSIIKHSISYNEESSSFKHKFPGYFYTNNWCYKNNYQPKFSNYYSDKFLEDIAYYAEDTNHQNLLASILIAEKELSRTWQSVNNFKIYASVLSLRGYALVKLGRVDEAIESYEKAIEIDPYCIDAISELAALK